MHPIITLVDFAIITALEEERDAVLSKFSDVRRLEKDGQDTHTYFEANVRSDRSDGATYRVIISSLAGMGPLMAAGKAQAIVTRWHPSQLLLVGIACGIPDDEMAHGDVLIASQVADYTLGKQPPQGKRDVRWTVHPAGPNLLDAAVNLPSNWTQFIQHPRPGNGLPSKHIGVIATGGDVVTNDRVIGEYHKSWPKLIGIEMEAGGTASALHNTTDRPEFLMIKGVSDFGKDKKDAAVKPWRPYANDTAASFAFALIQTGTGPSVAQRATRARWRRIGRVIGFALLTILTIVLATSWMRTRRNDAINTYSNHGMVALQNGRDDEAREAFTAILSIDPDHVPAHSNLSIVETRSGRLTEALQHAEAAAQKAPDVALYQYNLGSLLVKMGRPDEALARLHRAIEIDPGYVSAYNEIGNIHLKFHRPADARRVLTVASRHDPSCGPVAKNLARVALLERKPQEALEWLERAQYSTSDWRGNAEVAYWKASSNAAMDRSSEACAQLTHFHQLDPHGLTDYAQDAEKLAETKGCGPWL